MGRLVRTAAAVLLASALACGAAGTTAAGEDGGGGGGAAAPGPAVPAPRDGAVWPAGDPPRVVRGWSPPASPYGPGHRGVDLAAPPGAEVRAVRAGRIVFAGPVGGRGVLVVALSGTGTPPLRTTYEPVLPLLRKGARVEAGDPVATLAETGPFHCAEACLHWGLRRAGAYLNPLHLIRRPPSRLLPVLGVPVPG